MTKLLKLGFIFLGIMISSPVIGEPTFPPLQNKPLLDAANVISDQDELAINKRLTEISQKSSHQIMILVTPSLEGLPIVDYGYKAGRHYGIGSRDSDDGIFITIAPNEKKARIDTGYGIESTLTDAISKQIVKEDLIPNFKRNDWVGGINASLNRIADIIVPLSPEQILIQQREETNRKIRLEKQWNQTKTVLSYIFFGLLTVVGLVVIYLLLTKEKRREKKLEVQRIADKQKAERAAILEQYSKQLQELEDRKREQRENLLASMSPSARAAFLQKERDDHASARARESQRREEERSNRNNSDSNSVIFINTNSSDDSYKKITNTSESDDTISFFGEGGSFGGGGADGGWGNDDN